MDKSHDIISNTTKLTMRRYKKLAQSLRDLDPSYVDQWEVADAMNDLIDSVEFLVGQIRKFKKVLENDLKGLPEE